MKGSRGVLGGQYEVQHLSRAAVADTSSEQDGKEVIISEPMYEGEYCMPAEIDIDNESNDRFTLVTVSVKDYPGLVNPRRSVAKFTGETAKFLNFVAVGVSGRVGSWE